MKRFILTLLTILGYGAVATSCSQTNGGEVCEYGVPWVDFRISARVVDAEGNPIEGIEAMGGNGSDFLNYFYLGTTDGAGCLNIDAEDNSTPLYLLLRDTDGEANGGEFEEKLVDLQHRFEQVQEGEGNWYGGVVEAELGDITLEKRE